MSKAYDKVLIRAIITFAMKVMIMRIPYDIREKRFYNAESIYLMHPQSFN